MICFYYFVCILRFLYANEFTRNFYDKFGGREFTNEIYSDFAPVDVKSYNKTIKLSIHNASKLRFIHFSLLLLWFLP